MRRINLFDIFIHIIFIIVCIIMLYPFWYTIVGSMLGYSEYFRKTIFLWPEAPTLEAYRLILRTGLIFDPMKTTVLITITGTFYSLFFTAVTAYGLSKKFPGSRAVMGMIIFTMFFNGGIIPTYILYRNMGLINNTLVYILPMTVNTYNMIVMRTNFAGFPLEMEEAARIDGSGAFGVFFRIVLPLSAPILATIGLFFAVSYWNTFFPSVFYVTDNSRRTLQDFLNRIINASEAEDLGLYSSKSVSIQSVKMAATMMVVAPIVCVYPFLQKYFVKGVMIGAVKG